MLYLIEDRDYLKIGFTIDMKNRMNSYKTTNCYATLIDTKPGTRIDEKELHRLCEPHHYTREWFHNTQEVRDIWNNYIPDFYSTYKDLDIQNNEAIEFLYNCNNINSDSSKRIFNSLVPNLGTYNNQSMLKSLLTEIEDPIELKRCQNVLHTTFALHNLNRALSSAFPKFKYDFGKIAFDISHKVAGDEVHVTFQTDKRYSQD